MTMYQKIPTTSSRTSPLMAGAALAVIVLSVVATAAIVRWLPDARRVAVEPEADGGADAAGYATVSTPVAAARAPAARPVAADAGTPPRTARLSPI